ncbi:hypothetical protein [Chromobacterium haemolyticum]|uniref:hypothetical protein n=1 Tax=Chromobacterium haemolyticum TaxID=394935 RepID=UPI00307D6110
MNSHQLTFNLTYSIVMEEMHQTLMGRVDRFCTFAQLILGCAVVVSVAPSWLTGGLMAVLAGFQLVYQPSARAMEAKIQKERYYEIRRKSAVLGVEQLFDALEAASPHDSAIPGSLTHPAWLAASLQLDLDIPIEKRKLSKLEKAFSFIAGNCPDLTPTKKLAGQSTN